MSSKIRSNIQSLLLEKSFQKQAETTFQSFGDFKDVFISGNLLLIVTTDKGVPYIELGSTAHESGTFDIPLVKTLLSNPNSLLDEEPVLAELRFVFDNIEAIKAAFSPEEFDITSRDLEHLRSKRSTMLFPEWDPTPQIQD